MFLQKKKASRVEMGRWDLRAFQNSIPCLRNLGDASVLTLSAVTQATLLLPAGSVAAAVSETATALPDLLNAQTASLTKKKILRHEEREGSWSQNQMPCLIFVLE